MKKSLILLITFLAYFTTKGQGITGTINVCPNTSYTYSATTSDGGISAGTYWWYLDGVRQRFAGISYSASINIPSTSSSYLLSVVFTPTSGPTETYYLTLYSVSIGTVNASTSTVCYGGTVSVTVSNFVASSATWQRREGAGAWVDDPFPAPGNYSGQVYSNPTGFRLKTNDCGTVYSNEVYVAVDPSSVGGSISVDQSGSACGSATAGITVSGNVGTITQWTVRYFDSSWSASSTFSTSTSASITYPVVSGPGVSRTYEFKAVSKSGLCNEATSAPGYFVVNTISAGTAAINTTQVCYGSPVNLSISGQQGVQTIWQQSVSGGAWTDIPSSGTSNYTTTVNQNTSFRMRFGTCGPPNSNSVNVSVDPSSVGGSISVDQSGSACGSATAGITVSGNVGTITQWNVRYFDSSWSASSTFSTSNSASITYPVVSGPGVSRTYEFKAVSKSGLCNEATSAPGYFVVNTISAGTAAINTTQVCYGSPVNLSISGQQGAQTIWQQSVSGGVWTDIPSSGTSNYTTTVNQNTSFRMRFGTCGPPNSNSVNVSVDPLSVGGALASSLSTTCNSGTASLSLSGNTGAITDWFISYKEGTGSFTAPTSFSNSTSSTITYPVTSGAGVSRTYQFYATLKSGLCSSVNSSVAQIIVDPTSTSGTITSNQPIDSYGVSSATLTLSGNTGSILKWQQQVGATLTDIANIGTTLAYTNVTSTTQYRAVVQSGSCPVQYSPFITISIYAVPTIQFVGPTSIAIGGTTSIVSSTSYYSYQWIKNGVDVIGATTSSLKVTEPANYSLRIKATVSSPTFTTGNAVIKEAITNQTVKINYVATTTFLRGGINDATNLFTLTAADLTQQIQYTDGLGRIVQVTNIGASSSGGDVIQPIYFDGAGKETVSMLPYSRSARDGRYTASAIDNSGYPTSEQFLYYQNAAKVAHNLVPYSQTYFETSPLSRPEKQYGSGQEWRANYKYTRFTYSTNSDGTLTGQERIIAWTVNSSNVPIRLAAVSGYIVTGGYFASGQLSIKSTKDEQGNEVREYVDKEGRTILKKVQAVAGTAQTNNDSHWAMTYYIYDDFGNLVVVLPPEAVKTFQN